MAIDWSEWLSIKPPFLSRKRAITTFLSQKFMITRLSIAFEDFLGSSIASQVMPPCIPKTWKYSGHIDSKGRMRQVFKEIGDCKEILGHGLETDPRQKSEIGWIVRLLLRIVGGKIPLKPIGPPRPPPRKIMSQHCFCGGQNEGRGDLDSGREDLCVPSSAVCETYSFNATHQLIILRSFFLFLNKRTASPWVQRFSVLFVSSVSEVRSFLTTILN